eukprot:UN32096
MKRQHDYDTSMYYMKTAAKQSEYLNLPKLTESINTLVKRTEDKYKKEIENQSLKPSLDVDRLAKLILTLFQDLPTAVAYEIAFFAPTSHFCVVSNNIELVKGGFGTRLKKKEWHVKGDGYWGLACLGVPFPAEGGCVTLKLMPSILVTVGVIRTKDLDFQGIKTALKEHA